MDRSVFLSDIDGTLVRGDVLPAPEVVQAAMFSGRQAACSPCVPAEVWREPPCGGVTERRHPLCSLWRSGPVRFLGRPFSMVCSLLSPYFRLYGTVSAGVSPSQSPSADRAGQFCAPTQRPAERQGGTGRKPGPRSPLVGSSDSDSKACPLRGKPGGAGELPAVFPARAVLLHLLQPSLCGRGVRETGKARAMASWPNGWKSPSPSVCAPAME